MELRPVSEDELAHLKELRLRALLDAPAAFDSSYGEEAERPVESWRAWVTEGCTFVVSDERGWHGLVAVFVEHDDSTCHLVSMWVDPSNRGAGSGRDLLAAGVGWARRQGARKVRLEVVDDNSAAVGLYRKTGFVPTGSREQLRSDPSKTVVHMVLDLTEEQR